MALPSKELSEAALDALITRERTRIVAPLTEWRTLALQLREEGLLHAPDAGAGRSAGRNTAGSRPRPTTPRDLEEGRGWKPAAVRWSMRLAAGVALVGGGIVVGRGMTLGSDLVQTVRVAMQDADSTGSPGTFNVHIGGKTFSSPQDARRVLLKAQSDYERASAFLAATDTTGAATISPDVYKKRLAGLDEMTTTSMNALKDAPGDPLLSQYYLSASAAREGTLHQLGQSLPAGVTLVRF